MTPQERTLRLLAEGGYVAAVVEYHARHSLTAHDLFGCIDVLALRGLQTLGVQVTSMPNVADRVTKVRACPELPAMEAAGWRVVVHGWWTDGAKHRQPMREVVVLEGRPSWEQLTLEGIR